MREKYNYPNDNYFKVEGYTHKQLKDILLQTYKDNESEFDSFEDMVNLYFKSDFYHHHFAAKEYLSTEIWLEENTIDYKIPEWAIPAIINDDYSGVTEEEEKKIKDFLFEEKIGKKCFIVTMPDSQSYFSATNDIDNLGSNVYDVVVITNLPKEN